MSRPTPEWRPVCTDELARLTEKARRERAETVAALFGQIGTWFRGLFGGSRRERPVPVARMAARGR